MHPENPCKASNIDALREEERRGLGNFILPILWIHATVFSIDALNE